MLRCRIVSAAARQGVRAYATDSRPPQGAPASSQQQARPTQDAAKAEAQRKAEEAQRAAALKRAEEQKKAETAQKSAEDAKRSEQVRKIAEAKKADEAKAAKKAEDAKAAAAAAAAAAEPAPKAVEPAVEESEAPAKSVEAQNQELYQLLSKQEALLKRMAEDIEIARGGRELQSAINGEVQIKDISRIIQKQVQGRVDGVKTGARHAVSSMQENLGKSSVLAVEAAAEQRKQLSRLNREQQLPWQKDRPKAIYNEVGKWFLLQQRGIEAPVWMTAVEAGVIFVVLLFWFSQRRKASNKSGVVDNLLEDMNSEVDKARDTLHAAREAYNRDILKKEDELREMQSFSAEQSVTLDSLSRVLHERDA